MSQLITQDSRVGVGLRSEHYKAVLTEASDIDFVEVHSENFFAQGGVIADYLERLKDVVPISLHGTAMGLGSADGIGNQYLSNLGRLVRHVNPTLVSDHACFCWGESGGRVLHAGDLLPLQFNQTQLSVIANNVNRVQDTLGRQILVENIVSYVSGNQDFIDENVFLFELTQRTGCGLLIDLNNVLVNALNMGSNDALATAKNWLLKIPANVVGEIHLAGFTPAAPDQLIVDDHSQPVSDMCWELYRYAIELFGPKPTLIEWDNALPEWSVLLEEASKAKTILTNSTPRLLSANESRR